MKKSIKINAILNTCKQLCSVIIPLITIPYVSRVLQSTNYGKYNFSNSIVSYFALFAALGISNYAIREGATVRNNKNKIVTFAQEVFSINMIFTLISYMLLVVLLIISTKLKEYRLLIIIQSLSIMLTTLGADWINSIYEDYIYLTLRYIFIQILAVVSLFMFVQTSDDYINYAIIMLFASCGGNIFNIFYIRKYVHLKVIRKCNFKKHMKPILLLFFNAVAVTIYVNSDTTLLGIFKTQADVGIYSIASKIYTIIKQVINAVIIVTLPRLSLYLGENRIKQYKLLSQKIVNAICISAFPIMTGLLILSKEIIKIVGGISYIDGHLALKILSISLIFSIFAGYYCCCCLLPYKQEKICLIASIISALANIILNFIAIPLWGYNGAALTTLFSECIVFLIYFFKCKGYNRCDCDKKTILSTVIGCFLIAIICIFTKKFVINTYICMILSVFLSGISYLMILVLTKNELVMSILFSIRKKL